MKIDIVATPENYPPTRNSMSHIMTRVSFKTYVIIFRVEFEVHGYDNICMYLLMIRLLLITSIEGVEITHPLLSLHRGLSRPLATAGCSII